MRYLVALLALPLAILGGCAPLLLTRPDELYAATDYAPRPDADAPVFAGTMARPCADGLGVEALHGQYPVQGVRFRALPGMTLSVSQSTGRLSGASDVPIVSRWSWRIPNTAASGCGAALRWSQADVAIVRALLHGARASIGASPPDGDIGTPTAWGFTVQCLLGPRPVGTPDPCGDLPGADTTANPLVAHLYEPFAKGLGLTLRPDGGAPIEGQGFARQISRLAGRLPEDTPASIAQWQDAIACERPSHWRDADQPAAKCLPAFQAFTFSTAVAGHPGTALAPILRRPLDLLVTADPLLIGAPGPVAAMASPAYDLASGAPGSGGEPAPPGPSATHDARTPLGGEAYQGFLAFDLMIPIRIEGEAATTLVPITMTARDLGTWLGREVVAIGRLTDWLPARLSVAGKSRCKVERDADGTRPPSIPDCATVPANALRTFFRFDPQQGKGRFVVAPDDLLLAPGDLVIVR